MKSPADHYAEANRLLNLADKHTSEHFPNHTGEYKSDILAAAQVHALLASAPWSVYEQAWISEDFETKHKEGSPT